MISPQRILLYLKRQNMEALCLGVTREVLENFGQIAQRVGKFRMFGAERGFRDGNGAPPKTFRFCVATLFSSHHREIVERKRDTPIIWWQCLQPDCKSSG